MLKSNNIQIPEILLNNEKFKGQQIGYGSFAKQKLDYPKEEVINYGNLFQHLL